jgi:putative nucleotidyltransferase with HDIG domain
MKMLKQLQELAHNYSVLYVDDEPGILKHFSEYLGNFFPKVYLASNGEEGLKLYFEHQPDIVITDISMPLMDGLEMCRQIKIHNEQQEIIIISAFSDFNYLLQSITLGISGYMLKPIVSEAINKELFKILTRLEVVKENLRYKNNLEHMVAEKSAQLQQLQQDKIDNYNMMLILLVEMMEERDTYTAGHSQRVATYSQMIAKDMGYDKGACQFLYQAGILHDIGKIAIPDSILLNPKKLNVLEYKLIQEHVTMGYSLLSKIYIFKEIAEIIVAHHERYDGSGYPYGLKGDAIPPLSRIMMVADAFDAMTTNRIYKGRKSVEEALKEIVSLSGIHFHPDVVESALKVLATVKIDHTISQLPKTNLEKERFAYFYRDAVSGAHNRDYLEVVLFQNRYEKKYDEMLLILVHGFTAYNERFSWEKGDLVLRRIATVLMDVIPDDLLFRIHGDDFVLLSKAIDLDVIKNALAFLEDENLTISMQVISLEGRDPESLLELH